jgi:lipopolysaccharide/colanic/teichoic acid biosynthesis glycosyltransferase
MLSSNVTPQKVLPPWKGLKDLLDPSPATPYAGNEYALSLELAFFDRSRQWLYLAQQGVKRGVDILLSSVGIVVISPLLLGIALLIQLGSPGPILYKSERIGRNHKPFYMYKFRTMTTDADAQRDALRKQAQLENGLFKMKNDPRVTSVGKWLRAFSLDELPQLLNVLRGEMSLVGPRPLPPDESLLFEEPYTLRFQVLPGITGSWQVNGRSALNFEQLCHLEMNYVLEWTLLTDLQILFRTLPAVLASRGAY